MPLRSEKSTENHVQCYLLIFSHCCDTGVLPAAGWPQHAPRRKPPSQAVESCLQITWEDHQNVKINQPVSGFQNHFYSFLFVSVIYVPPLGELSLGEAVPRGDVMSPWHGVASSAAVSCHVST